MCVQFSFSRSNFFLGIQLKTWGFWFQRCRNLNARGKKILQFEPVHATCSPNVTCVWVPMRVVGYRKIAHFQTEDSYALKGH